MKNLIHILKKAVFFSNIASFFLLHVLFELSALSNYLLLKKPDQSFLIGKTSAV